MTYIAGGSAQDLYFGKKLVLPHMTFLLRKEKAHRG